MNDEYLHNSKLETLKLKLLTFVLANSSALKVFCTAPLMKPLFVFFLFFAANMRIVAQNTAVPFQRTPCLGQNRHLYGSFVERFRNGDPTNDPKPVNINTPPIQLLAPPGWSVTPWTHNWYEQEAWAKKTGKPFTNVYPRRFRRRF